jgi:glycosyltransferase involved in cell wall biosynthesis
MKDLADGSKRLRILIVAYAFPPMNAIGSHRPYSWARFWRDEGHEIHVLTASKHDFDGMMDLERDLKGIRVYEVPYFPMGGSHPGSIHTGTHSAVGRWEWLKTITRRARFSLAMFGDPRLLAYRPMVRKGMDIICEARFDFIIASSPPEVCFFVARALSRRAGVPWVADFRDLWFRDMRLYQSRLASWMSGPVNSWLVKCATVMVTVSRGLRNRLSEYMGRDVFISYNGFFETDRYSLLRDQPRNDGKLHIVYTGRFYPGKRDPEPLFRAIRSLRAKGFDTENRIEVDIYGFDDPWLRGLIRTYELEKTICLHGFVPYSRSMEVQYAADVLLFLDWTEVQAEGLLTGKLFEYLGTGRPILSVGRRKDSEAAHLIAEAGCGVTLTTDAEIEDFLLCLLSSGRPPSVGSAARELYSRERQARLLLEALAERVLSPAHLPMPYCGRGNQFE